ncbi:DegT/DnrJ/EryC1/StrS aminotransferase family protein [Runella sp. SP2]|uniref:DegT/DnrJ/EryC1/StrS family aminotransferase n=1 Tax=Runella sp. SP2 TaxID=2268026 RepID=UPI000F07EA52|nr:DegT/DnrJ/EryC1/StrS family aminotransferase [Runella sp. SP2]AYQ33753.1 DegT/DnrJ/EryC1/StrS family aminotransferase [Runella sp. SP2]
MILDKILEKPMNEYPVMDTREGIVLFYPNIPAKAASNITEVLQSRWIGQGPKVDEFEHRFELKFTYPNKCLAVGSGTDALHLAYLLADLQPGDEVIAPVFTCTATNIPFLYMGVNIVFADVDDNLNIDVKHVEQLITPKTKAIVCVHYGGLPCDMDELWALGKKHNLFIIEDAAHAVGAKYKGRYIGSESDFTMFSFQAIKHITTGDGGMLVVKDPTLVEKAKRLRWFGIDRTSKQKGIWENDIVEVGYKYQMTDIAASLGLAGLEEFDEHLAHRQRLYRLYCELLKDIPGIRVIGSEYTDREHAAWLLTAEVDHREDLMRHLREHGIESGQVHYRNDKYSIFGGRTPGQFPKMDAIEERYLVLPLHARVTEDDIRYIAYVLQKGW